jgi:hypothetical protein
VDIEKVAEALAEAARTCTYPSVAGPRPLHAHAFAADQVDPPSLEVGEVELGDDLTFDDDEDDGGAVEMATFTLRIYVPRSGGPDAGHPLLRRFLATKGPGSVKTAIEADRTLGGVVDTLLVPRRYGYGVYEVSGTQYLGARIDVQVWGRSNA